MVFPNLLYNATTLEDWLKLCKFVNAEKKKSGFAVRFLKGI